MEFFKKLFKSQNLSSKEKPAPAPEKPLDRTETLKKLDATISKLESLDMAPTMRKLDEQKQEIQDLAASLDAKKEQLAKMDRDLEGLSKMYAEKDKMLAEKDKMLAEKDKMLAKKEQDLDLLEKNLTELEKSYAVLNKNDPDYERKRMALKKIADSLQPEVKRLIGREDNIWERLVSCGTL